MSMRPTFMGFETATRGLMTNQKALDVVANNTTNIGVTGYTRQRVDLVSLNVNMRYTRYNMNTTSFAGQGVNTYGVSQIRDAFLDKRFREEYADVGYYNVTAGVLEDLHSSMDEIMPSTMKTAMDKFMDCFDQLLQKNEEKTGSANLLASATQIVQVFRQMSAKIDNVWNQQQYSLSLDVDSVNSILQRVAQLNDEISHQKFNSMDVGNQNYQPLELLDQRNVLLDELSKYANVTYREESDGTVTVKMGTQVAVSGKEYHTLATSVDREDDRFPTVRIFWNDSGKDVDFSTGSMRANIDMLNGRGVDFKTGTKENMSQGVLYYKEKIDQLARTFANAFNTVVEIADTSVDPVASFDPPRYKQLFQFDSDALENASNISVGTSWEADSTYLYSDILDKLGGSDSNTYAAKAIQRFKDTLDFGEFKGNLFDYISFYSNTKLNNDKAYADSRLESVSGIADDLLNKIQNVSGVSMEEEGVDMLMYKKAYDAVSRVFTTLDEMLDKLINSTGVVGR